MQRNGLQVATAVVKTFRHVTDLQSTAVYTLKSGRTTHPMPPAC